MGLLLLLLSALPLQANTYTVAPATEAPQWQIDWSYNQERPDWHEPASGDFENWTVVLVNIEEALKPYASADDLMAVFVDDEIRGLASPAVIVAGTDNDATSFLLKIWGNESGNEKVRVSLRYYNSRLKHIFSLSEDYTVGEELGIDQDFTPPFTLGSAKYPVTKTINVAAALVEAGITLAKGDIVAAFVGDECRGVGDWTSNGDITVSLRNADEDVVLKYYDSTGNRILSLNDATSGVVTGDATGDGVVDVSDYIGIANYILGNAPEGFNELAADVNGDGIVDVSDYIGVANIILYGNIKGK